MEQLFGQAAEELSMITEAARELADEAPEDMPDRELLTVLMTATLVAKRQGWSLSKISGVTRYAFTGSWVNEKYLEGSEELVQQLTDWRIAETRAGATGTRPSGYDGTCPECGVAVPPARVALAFYNCVDCQTEEERRKRLEKYNGARREPD